MSYATAAAENALIHLFCVDGGKFINVLFWLVKKKKKNM